MRWTWVVWAVLCLAGARPSGAAWDTDGVGACRGGRGGAGVADPGFFSTNPAGPAGGGPRTVSASCVRLYGMAALSACRVEIRGGRGRTGWAAGASAFGGPLYSETTLTVGAARRLSRVDVGAALRIETLRVEGWPAEWGTAVDLGMRSSVTDRVVLGLSVLRFRAADPGEGAGRGRPRVRLGWVWQATEEAAVYVDVEQDAGGPRRLRVGVDVPVSGPLVLRAGWATDPDLASAGFGLVRGTLGLDVSADWHAVLGVSERVTLCWTGREAPSGTGRGEGEEEGRAR